MSKKKKYNNNNTNVESNEMMSVTNDDTFTSDEVSNVADNVADKVEEVGAVEEVSTQEDTSAVAETAPVEEAKEVSETEELSKAEAVSTVEIVNDTVDEAAEKSVEQAAIKTEEISKISNNKEIKKMDKDLLEKIQSEDMKAIASLLVDIKKSNEKQMLYTRIQMCCSLFACVLAVIVVIVCANTIGGLLPQINQAITQANTALEQTNSILSEVQPVINNLNRVTNDLATADITGMLEDVDELVVSSEKNMGEALKTVTDIDIASLNQAIEDLSSIVGPMARMFR